MHKFQFRLAPLLRLNEAARDDRRAQLAEAYRAEEVLRGRIGELERELAELKQQSRRTAMPGALDVDRLIDTQRYELLLLAQRQALAQHEQRLATEIERRREALVLADREVRILDRLRETQQQAHRVQVQHEEAKLLDEAAARPRETENA